MKKYIALLLCGALLMSLTACGKPKDKGSTATTQSTVTTTAGEGSTTTTAGDASTTTGTDGTTASATTTTGKKPTASVTTTTVYVPSGATVPIGTKPATTTTTAATSAPTKTPTGGETTTTTTVTTQTTTTGTKPPAAQPYIVLPAIGTDIDVTKQKNRIHVSAVGAWYNDDGSIGVALTFKNNTSNWITEETDYVMYACYDKNGKALQQAAKLMIGCIDTKKTPEKTFYFDVPADTAEVRLVKSKIVYWTEWS